jgi:uncharacterized protein (DUF2342 family)
MMAEIVLVAGSTLVTIVVQYAHSMAAFGHHVPECLLVFVCMHEMTRVHSFNPKKQPPVCACPV